MNSLHFYYYKITIIMPYNIYKITELFGIIPENYLFKLTKYRYCSVDKSPIWRFFVRLKCSVSLKKKIKPALLDVFE
jgi:hypothetical protein